MDFKSILANLNILIRPWYWSRVGLTNKTWDKELNCLLDKYDFFWNSEAVSKLGPKSIWIENHPYASFSEGLGSLLPSRKTSYRARKRLIESFPKIFS
jgi:hypothetical protein